MVVPREIWTEVSGVGELNHLGARSDGVELKEGLHQKGRGFDLCWATSNLKDLKD